MDIFITGRLKSISTSLVDRLASSYQVVLASEDFNRTTIGEKSKSFSEPIGSQGFNKLFTTYSFNTVLYFCGRPDEKCVFDDMKGLEATLKACSDHDVEQVIVVSSTYVYSGLTEPDEETQPVPNDASSVLLYSLEKLCEAYRENNALKVLILRVPVLFGMYEEESFIGNIAKQIETKKFAHINGLPNQHVDFLSQDDLAELLKRIMLEWPSDLTNINIPGAKQMTLQELGNVLKQIVPATRISFSEKSALIYPPVSSGIAREIFEWSPVISIEDDITDIIKNIGSHKMSAFKKLKKKIYDYFGTKNNIVMVIELVIGYLLMELLNRLTSTTSQFIFVDFRLLFVVLLGTLHGLNVGIAAAVLASISLTLGFMNDGADWTMLIYNVDNWLPYAAYLITGAITGYTCDKRANEYTYLKEEWVDLDARYKFLNEVYNSSLQNKNQFKKQIISYRDSFGRIFEITKRLNTVLPEAIFKEALLALEDILENQTISIYSVVENSKFGRLRVSSKKILNTAPKSFDLTKHDKLVDELRAEQVWKNTEMIPSYPDYVYPIYSEEGSLALLVIVSKVTHEQMAMYFENLLKIVCSLIQEALLRAKNYNEKFSDEFYIQGTKILKRDAFRDVLRVKAQMEEVAISEYSLLSVAASKDNIVEIGERLQKYLRESDIIGEGDGNQLYIILSQANESDIPYILSRLEKAGLSFSQVSDENLINSVSDNE